MMIINKISNGVPVSEGANNDICCVNAWLIESLWEVKNKFYTHKVDSFSDFNGQFSRSNINEFIDSLTATGKYSQIRVTYHSAN